MKILVACEFSGIVRDAFAARGHDAWSCDLLPSERPGNHYQGDVFEDGVISRGWDLVIAHPPCTHLSSSGARYFEQKRADGRQQSAVDFFMRFVGCAPKWMIENPVGVMSRIFRKPDQIIQPYQFGHPESKATCLWLHGLPLLEPTEICKPQYMMTAGLPLFGEDPQEYRDSKGKRYSKTHYFMGRGQMKRWANQTPSGQNKLGPSPERAKIRSRTYEGIAKAMAEQWGASLTGSPFSCENTRMVCSEWKQ
jgi:hypothetical protein